MIATLIIFLLVFLPLAYLILKPAKGVNRFPRRKPQGHAYTGPRFNPHGRIVG